MISRAVLPLLLAAFAGCPPAKDDPKPHVTMDAAVEWPALPVPPPDALAVTDAPSDPAADPADAAKSCACGSERSCPAGAIYATRCAVCKCSADGQSGCQIPACPAPDAGAPDEPPRCENNPAACPSTGCVFDQGCEHPKAYCALTQCANTFSQTFCGCDGETFTTDCPRKPYRHVGACR
jgi:hypothetical protein